MAKATKKTARKTAAQKKAAKKAPATKVSRPRPRLDEKQLRTAEAELKKKYPHIVKGTLRNAENGGPHNQKRTVEIKCSKPGCQVTRRVATSDLAQVTMCEEHTRQARLERRRAARKAKATAKKKTAKKTAARKPR